MIKERIPGTFYIKSGLLSGYTFRGYMCKSITANAIAAVTTAGLAATLTIFLMPGVVPEAKAYSQVTVMLPALAVVDRLPAIERGDACSSRGWPNYEQSCLFDLRTPAKEARPIRIIVLR